ALDDALKNLQSSTIPQGQRDVATADTSVKNAVVAVQNAQQSYAAAVATANEDVETARVTVRNAQVALGDAQRNLPLVTAQAQQDVQAAAAVVATAEARVGQVMATRPTAANISSAKAQVDNAQYALESALGQFNAAMKKYK